MSNELLEVEQLRFRVKSLEAQLCVFQNELDEKRRDYVSMAVALKRQNGRVPASVPMIPGLDRNDQDPLNDLSVRDERSWERLRLEFFRVCDELVRVSIVNAEESLQKERERRLRDIEYMRNLLMEKEKELGNYKAVSESQLKKSVELEDKLAKLRTMPSTSCISSAPSTARSTSPSPPSAQVFSRNYFPVTQSQNSTMTSMSLAMPPQQYTTNVPMFSSPVLVSRQVLPNQSIYRRGSS